MCINMHRCAGAHIPCCTDHEICAVKKSEEVSMYGVGLVKMNKKIETKFINLLNHTECSCECKLKTNEDCQKLYGKNYFKVSNECDCECRKPKCASNQYFDIKTCSCKCKDESLAKQCQTRGFVLNEETCG